MPAIRGAGTSPVRADAPSPRDRDLEETAVRETWEETGVDLTAHGRILGTLDDLAPRISALPPLVIRPFVAVVEPDVTVVSNPEVADAFWVPLSALRERASWGLGMVDIRGTVHRGERVPSRRAHRVGADREGAEGSDGEDFSVRPRHQSIRPIETVPLITEYTE